MMFNLLEKKVLLFKKLAIFLCSSLYLITFHLNAASLPKVTWYQIDFAPFSILKGDDAGKGHCNLLQSFLGNNLPGYTNTNINVNIARLIKEIRRAELGCYVCLSKTAEREKFMHFSVATDVWIPNGIIIRKADLAKFADFIDESGSVDFENYLQTTKFTIGYASKRSYGQPIDNALDKFKDSSSLYAHKGSNAFKSLFSMLNRGRVDSIIGYAHELEFHSKAKEMRGQLQYLPIHDSFVSSHVGCSKTPSGAKLIAKLNVLIESNREKISSFYRSNLSEEYQQYHQKISREYFAGNNE